MFKYHLEQLNKEYEKLEKEFNDFKELSSSSLPIIKKFPPVPSNISNFLTKYSNLTSLFTTKNSFNYMNKDVKYVSSKEAGDIFIDYCAQYNAIKNDIIEYDNECKAICENNIKVKAFIINMMTKIGIKLEKINYKNGKTIKSNASFLKDLIDIETYKESMFQKVNEITKMINELHSKCLEIEKKKKDDEQLEQFNINKIKALGLLSGIYFPGESNVTFASIYNKLNSMIGVPKEYLDLLNTYYTHQDDDE